MKTINFKTGTNIVASFCLLASLTAELHAQTGCSSFTGNTIPVLSTSNTAGGVNCMLNMRTGSPTGQQNTAFGVRALEQNTAGHSNSAFGLYAGRATTGTENSAFGTAALDNNTSGGGNTAFGVLALTTNGTGGVNTAIGWGANVSTGALSNSGAFGYQAVTNASNKIRIGDANVTVIEGQVDFTFVSDGRFKTNVNSNDVKGLEFIKLLRPVVYNFQTREFQEFLTKNMPDSLRQLYLKKNFETSTSIRHSGFIAQEVEKAAQDAGYNFDAVHKPVDENDNYGLAYGQFVVPLVKAVQEQQKMIEDLQNTINELKQKQSISTGIEQDLTSTNFELGQNIPNPFTHETVIKYNAFPTVVKEAYMAVFDLSGKQVAKFSLDTKVGSIAITSEKLSAGIYIYTIVADGRALDSKRMIVAEK